MRPSLLPLLTALVACQPDPTPESDYKPGGTGGSGDPTDDTGDTDDPGDDTGDEVSDEPLGVLVVIHWPEDRSFAASTWTHGVFSTDERWAEVVDPVGLLSFEGVEAFMNWQGWPLAEAGEDNLSFDEDLDWDPLALETLDAGERFFIGPELTAYRLDEDGLFVYDSDSEEFIEGSPFEDGALDLWVEGGDDIAQAEVLGAVAVPDAVELTSHDPLAMNVMTAEEPLTVTWDPSDDPDAHVLVTVQGGIYTRAYGAADDAGELTIAADELQAQGGDFLVVTVARMVESEVQLPEGVLLVRAIHEVWSEHVQVEELGFSPVRGLTGDTVAMELYRAGGVFDPADTVLDLGDDITVTDLRVSDDGHTAFATIELDEDAESDFRDVLVTTGGETLLAPNGFGVYHELEGGESCPEAEFLPSIREGFHFDRRDGRVSDMGEIPDCETGLDYVGADSFHKLSMLAGETVSITAYWDEGDGVIALLDGCDGTSLACFDDSSEFGTELLEYTADEDRDVIIVFDESLGADDADLFVSLEIDPAVELYLSGGVLQGETGVVEIDNRVWDFVDGQPVFDFGPDITVDAVVVPGGTGPLAEVTVSVAADAAVGFRTITVTQGADTGTSGDDRWKVQGTLPSSDSCSDADALDPLESTTWFGSTDGLTDQGFDTSACGSGDLSGADAIYRFDVPAAGNGISASLESLTWDGAVYIVRDCDGATLPVLCTDVAAAGESEVINWTAGAGESGTWYLVVDAPPEQSGEFSLSTTLF